MSFPKRGKSFHPDGTQGGGRSSFAAGIADDAVEPRLRRLAKEKRYSRDERDAHVEDRVKAARIDGAFGKTRPDRGRQLQLLLFLSVGRRHKHCTNAQS